MKYPFFIIAVFLAVVVSAQDPYYWELTDEDGLPSMTVYNIQQDSQGYMWIGTAAGLCRYDGKEFKYYNHSEQADEEIMQLKVDSEGRVWYSNLSGQLFYIDNGEVRKAPDFGAEGGFKLHRIYPGREGGMILTYNLGRYEEEVKGMIVFTFIRKGRVDFKQAINLKAELRNGTVWKNEFIFINPDKPQIPSIKSLKFKNHIDSIPVELYSETQRRQYREFYKKYKKAKGEAFIEQGKNREVFQFSSSGIMKFNFSSPDSKIKHLDFFYAVSSVLRIEDKYWVFTKEGGVHLVDPGSFRFVANYFSSETLNQGCLDREKNVWIATNTEGVKIIPSRFFLQKSLNTNQKKKSIDVLYSIREEGGVVLVGCEESVFEIRGKNVINQIKLKNVSRIRAFTSANNSLLYVATDNSLVTIGKRRKVEYWNNLVLGGIKILFMDEFGNLWYGNFSNCLKLVPDFSKKYLSYKHPSQLDEFSVLPKRTYAIFAIENTTWIGTDRGLYKYVNNKAEPFLENGVHHSYRYSSIIQSSYDSSIWAATHGDGILRIKNDEVIAHYTEDSLLVSNICNHLFADDYGNVWAATNRGLQKFNLKNNTIELINKYDGLPTDEITQVTVLDSLVYVGTNKGLITFPLDAKTRNDVPPPVHITNISIFEKDTALFDAYDLTYEQNSIQIDFVGLAYKCRGDVQYKYRMLGIDTGWVSTETRFARFPGVSPGNYEFQVVALNEDGVESVEPATVKFYVNPPFWQTWWFRVLTGLAIVGTIAAIFNSRYQRIRRQEKLEQDFKNQVNELRGRALQTQMNPHFIFNSLNAIQHFLTTNDQEHAMIYLARFAKLIRHIFDQSKEKTITLAQELEFLKLYVSLEELRFQNKINVDFYIDKSVKSEAEELELPPLLIQPIIENAFKHGLFHKKESGNLLIQFSYKNGILKSIIEDDGIGRTRSREINKWKRGKHKSSGLESTMERLHLLNTQENGTPNKLEITDLFNSEGEASGTRVEINLKPKNYD